MATTRQGEGNYKAMCGCIVLENNALQRLFFGYFEGKQESFSGGGKFGISRIVIPKGLSANT